MMSETAIPGMDVSRDWLEGFCLPGQNRFRHPDTADGHIAPVAMIQQPSDTVKAGFEATGGHEWVLRTEPVDAGIVAVRLSPARIRAFALGPEAGRELPDEKLRIPGPLTARRGQLVDMRKRLKAQIGARRKQGVPADVETMDDELEEVPDTQVDHIERRIENVIAQAEPLAAKANLPRSIPGTGPALAAMPIAELPEPGRRTTGQAAAMTGPAAIPHDSGAMRGRRTIAGGRRSLRHVPFQAARAAACHDPIPEPVARRLKERGKPHKLVIIAIARRLVTIADAIIKTGIPWQLQPGE